MENNGRVCARNGGATKMVDEIIKALGEDRSIHTIIDKMNEAGIGGGKLIAEENRVVGVYEHCYCPSREHIESNIYCMCTQGWAKEVFEKAFERKVDVVLDKAIAWGDECCQFTVSL